MGSDPRDWMWSEACAVLERMEQMHRQFFLPGIAGTQIAAWRPPVDVLESVEDLRILAALPGVEAQDVEVAIGHDVLLISGMRHPPAMARGAAIHRLEIPYGRFERQVQLPPGRLELAQSDLVNGCLAVVLRKRR